MTKFIESIKVLMENPLSLAAVIIVLLLILFAISTKKIKFTPLLMTQIALSVAISAILELIVLFKFPQGGSVTLASMLPIIIMAYTHGPQIGILTGFLVGVINLFMGPTIIHPLQTLLDYPLPYMLVGASAYIKNNQYAGAIFGTVLRLLMHILSGVIFFAQYAPEDMQSGFRLWQYSAVYNGSFLAIELVILLVIMAVIPWDRLINELSRTTR